jgi:hypothetical protein
MAEWSKAYDLGSYSKDREFKSPCYQNFFSNFYNQKNNNRIQVNETLKSFDE